MGIIARSTSDWYDSRIQRQVYNHVHVSRLRDTSWTEGPQSTAERINAAAKCQTARSKAWPERKRREESRERENERWSGLRYKAPHGPLGRTCTNETQPRSNRIPDRPRHVIAVLDHGLVSKILRNRFSTCSLYRLHDFFGIFFFFLIWFRFRRSIGLKWKAIIRFFL